MTTLRPPKTRLQRRQITPAEPFSKQAGVQPAAALTQPDGLQTQHATQLTQPASQQAVLLAGQTKTLAGQLTEPQTKPTRAPDTLLTRQLMGQDGRATMLTMLVSLLAEQLPRLRTM